MSETPLYDELRDKWLEAPKREVLKELLEVQQLLDDFDNDCPVALVPKRKFKLFGRNQGTDGTL